MRDYSMDFELCVRQFLGDKAYHIADSFGNPVRVRQWLRKCLVVAKKRIDQIDTTTRHREMLLANIETLSEKIKEKDFSQNVEIVIAAFWLISRLLGYDYVSGVYNEIFYYQKPGQRIRQQWAEGKGSWQEQQKERANWITARRKIIDILKKEGYSDYDAAQILNISEYELKRYKHL